MRLSRTVATLLSICLLTATVAAQGAVSGTVYQTTNVRSGPDTRFEIVRQLSANDTVQIDGRSADSRWLHVILPSGEEGWLPVFALIVDGDIASIPVFEEEATPSPQSDVTVTSYGRVNVRSGPGIDYAIVGQLDVDEHAQALARSSAENDWLMIRFDDSDGWVAFFTVDVQGDPTTLPVLVPDSSGESLIPPSRLVRARFNVRLHQIPDLDSPVVEIVPFDSEVTPIGRSADSNWLFVGFSDASGWGVTQLFDISDAEVATLPVHPQAEATAQP